MPFKSEKQRKWMHANEPEMAKKWEKEEESVNEANVIQKIDKLAKRNKYGTVDGTQMNGKTAREIIAIFKHPKMNSYRNQMLKMKSHELVDLTLRLLKPLKINVEARKMSESVSFLKKGIKAFVSEKMGPEQYHRYMQYVFDTQFNTSDEKKMKKSIIKKINVAQKKKGLPLFKEEDLVDEGFGGELKGKDKEKFEKARKENAEVLGYKLTGESDIRESVNESRANVKKAIAIAKKMGGNMTGAVKKIEKIQKGLSKQVEVEDALRKANESVKESDLGYTTKKQKVVRAVHKTSGKELIYVDTPSSRKMLKKMGFVVKESVNESVKVRNGEAPMEGKWAVCDISTGKAIKEVGNVRAATRLMNRLMNSGQYKEVAAKWVGEAKSKTIKTIGSIIGKKQAQKIDGVLVDMQTANVIMKVWNALNKSNRKKFENLPIRKMANVAWKLMK